MQHLKIIFVLVTLIALSALIYTSVSLNTKLVAQENAIGEIVMFMKAGGVVVPDKDGNPMANPLLLEAWKQANQIP